MEEVIVLGDSDDEDNNAAVGATATLLSKSNSALLCSFDGRAAPHAPPPGSSSHLGIVHRPGLGSAATRIPVGREEGGDSRGVQGGSGKP